MLSATLASLMLFAPQASRPDSNAEPGQMTIIRPDGTPGMLCPLEKTIVNADIAGYGARVVVQQTFQNPSPTPIEAVYTFPLPNDAAVDRMRMKIGTRVIEGEIARREDARRIYDAAKAAGQTASLLDQERPNIFTQSVANIMPGLKVEIEISYVQILKFEEGEFEFNFPMVVGPRFLGNAKDPDKIAPPTLPPGVRSGATIDLNVNIDAGAPIVGMRSVLHEVSTTKVNASRAKVTLKKKTEMANKDFILRYRPTTDSIQTAFLTHMDPDGKGGFFTLILLPPKEPTVTQIAPKEIIFVMDQSGSQNGFPIEKSKELTLKLIKTLRPGDTFNVIGFNNTIRPLWTEPRDRTPENVAQAEAFVGAMQANGGTQLREGVIAALNGQNDPNRLRLVVFNTDGFVGDEAAVLDTIQKQRDRARMFTFGIGNGVNRFLIDSMSMEGKGDCEYVTLAEAADGAVQRFIKRTQSPLLLNPKVTFEGVDVEQVLPEAIPDVFSDKPIVVFGRFSTAGRGKATVSGDFAGRPWSKTVDLNFGAASNAGAIQSLWARKMIDQLTSKNYLMTTRGEGNNQLQEQITKLALDHKIMSAYTSFVAVEKRVVNIGGKQRTIRVPVEMTDGVNINADSNLRYKSVARAGALLSNGRGGGFAGGGVGGGGGAGSAGGGRAQDKGGEVAENRPVDKDALKKWNYENRVDEDLRKATGNVEIEVWVKKVDEKLLAALKAKGLKVEFSDAGMKIVIGTLDAAKLIELAQIEGIERVKRSK